MAGNKTDEELTGLLTKLYGIQEDIGSKPASSDAEKKAKASQVATLGSNKKAAEKGSKFLSLKSTIIEGLKTINSKMKELKEKESQGYGGSNPKITIKLTAEIRETIRQVTDEWKELDELYKKEARKKRSKFTEAELETQQTLVEQLYLKIEEIEKEQKKGYGANRQGDAPALNSTALFMDAPGGKKSGWQGSGGGVATTEAQKQQILQLEERDADFDNQLDAIGQGVQDLAEIAALQGEEVTRQGVQLEQLNNKMDKINERMVSVNESMKETLEEVARSSGKLCVDIMCIIVMIGFAGTIYSFLKK